MSMHEYAGNIHVHTTYSDGTKSVEGVAREAARAGLDFVMLSDHGTLAPLVDGKEGYHDGVLMLVGMEVGEAHNHYLAWRVDKVVPDDPEKPQRVIDGVRDQGGIGFIAHPHEKGCKYGYKGHAFTWEDWGATGYTGICVWNFTSQWKEPVTNPAKAVYYYLYRRGAVRTPEPATMAAWDAELKGRKVVAIGGTDAHAFKFGFGPVKPRIFPYRYLFRTINTHIISETPFSGDAAHDKEVVYSAIERGRCFVGYDLLGDTRGFRFTASSGGERAVMGGDIPFTKGMKLEVALPGQAFVRVIKDGVVWAEGKGAGLGFEPDSPGVYRVEAYRRGLLGGRWAWIISNPVYVRP